MTSTTRSLIVLALCSLATTSYANSLVGSWTLNKEETAKFAKSLKTVGNRGLISGVSVGVGGVLVPTQRSAITPTRTLQPPIILDCEEAQISKVGEKVFLTCNEVDKRRFDIGKFHGRVTTWSDRRLKERYSSTSRTVEHRFHLKKPDLMEVKLFLKPKGARRMSYTLIYDRKQTSSSPVANTPEESS